LVRGKFIRREVSAGAVTYRTEGGMFPEDMWGLYRRVVISRKDRLPGDKPVWYSTVLGEVESFGVYVATDGKKLLMTWMNDVVKCMSTHNNRCFREISRYML
jgi:hypothetical protein